jgi:hypothetical protein
LKKSLSGRSSPSVRFLQAEDSIVNGKLPPIRTAIFPVVTVVHAVQIRLAAVEYLTKNDDDVIR